MSCTLCCSTSARFTCGQSKESKGDQKGIDRGSKGDQKGIKRGSKGNRQGVDRGPTGEVSVKCRRP
eukprot:2839472-Pyramimonas_sp.AAC.1